jgi:hypothetical protein
MSLPRKEIRKLDERKKVQAAQTKFYKIREDEVWDGSAAGYVFMET